MAESAALLVDEVLPGHPVRQWVLSFPYPSRFLFATRPQVMGQVNWPPTGREKSGASARPRVPMKNVPCWYNAADVFTMPYRETNGGTGAWSSLGHRHAQSLWPAELRRPSWAEGRG